MIQGKTAVQETTTLTWTLCTAVYEYDVWTYTLNFTTVQVHVHSMFLKLFPKEGCIRNGYAYNLKNRV